MHMCNYRYVIYTVLRKAAILGMHVYSSRIHCMYMRNYKHLMYTALRNTSNLVYV